MDIHKNARLTLLSRAEGLRPADERHLVREDVSLASQDDVDISSLVCGLEGGAIGFNRCFARLGNLVASFHYTGSVDVGPAAIKDSSDRAGVEGTVLDLFGENPYAAFDGKPPPSGWKTAKPADILRPAHGERPHIVFLPPQVRDLLVSCRVP